MVAAKGAGQHESGGAMNFEADKEMEFSKHTSSVNSILIFKGDTRVVRL